MQFLSITITMQRWNDSDMCIGYIAFIPVRKRARQRRAATANHHAKAGESRRISKRLDYLKTLFHIKINLSINVMLSLFAKNSILGMICKVIWKKVKITVFPMLAVLSLMSGCIWSPKEMPKATNGVLDLTSWELSTNGVFALNGEWDFFWMKFLDPSDRTFPSPDRYIDVPSTWNGFQIKGIPCSGQGFATYRLKVRHYIMPGTKVGFHLNSLSSAYRLYVNKTLMASNGQVATSPEKEVGEYRPQAIIFNVPETSTSSANQENFFFITLQISNYHYAKGGFWNRIYMGEALDIMDFHDRVMGKAFFLTGLLFIVSLFFLSIFLFRRELIYTLYFAMLCFLEIIAQNVVEECILSRLIYPMPLNTVIFIWYTSTNWGLCFLLLFLNELYKSKFSQVIVRIYFIIVVFSQFLYVFTPPLFYTQFASIWNVIEIIMVLSTIGIVIIAVRKSYHGAWLNLMAMMLVSLVYVHDILMMTNTINHRWGYLFFIGVSIFILIQMIIQAQRIKVYHEEKSAANLKFLQSQIKPHFLYNTLNTFISISRYDMDKARSMLVNFSNYLRRSFDFKSVGQSVPLISEISLAESYIRIETIRFEDRVNILFNIDKPLRFDSHQIMVPVLVLQPLIENALNHGILPKPEGGKIEVSIVRKGKIIHFSIKDNGVGMEHDMLKKIKTGNYINETGNSSIGIANIDSRLNKIYGRGLIIKSELGLGTKISWQIRESRR